MSLLVASSNRIKRLVKPSVHSKPTKSTQRFGGRKSYSNQSNSDFAGLRDDSLTKTASGGMKGHLDPRTVQGTVVIGVFLGDPQAQLSSANFRLCLQALSPKGGAYG